MKKTVAKIAGALTSIICGFSAFAGCVDSEAGNKTYTDEEKLLYTPNSVVMTLYDAENTVYGFTYNTQNKPVAGVLQIEEGTELTGACKEYSVSTTVTDNYVDIGDTQTSSTKQSIYISKVEVELKSNTTYTYRLYDKKVDVGTETVTITTVDPSATAFRFSHVGDSQTANKKEADFGKVLDKIIDNGADFVVHTGDVVEWPKYEDFWTRMLDGNFAQLSRIPVMAISGNHETTYQNGINETFEHFNYKLPEQKSTNRGLFYSYVYGNVKFIMLNTNDLLDNKIRTEEYDWLVAELESNTCAWTVVAMHNPLYSAGVYGYDSIALALQSQLSGVFAEYGVDLVLQGHDHLVSRTFPIDADGNPVAEDIRIEDGIEYSYNPSAPIYVMNGPTTDQTRTTLEEYTESRFSYALTSYERSWADFEIDGNTLTVTVNHLSDDGTVEVYQTWGIKKD